jgi:hypothetical protein
VADGGGALAKRVDVGAYKVVGHIGRRAG